MRGLSLFPFPSCFVFLAVQLCPREPPSFPLCFRLPLPRRALPFVFVDAPPQRQLCFLFKLLTRSHTMSSAAAKREASLGFAGDAPATMPEQLVVSQVKSLDGRVAAITVIDSSTNSGPQTFAGKVEFDEGTQAGSFHVDPAFNSMPGIHKVVESKAYPLPLPNIQYLRVVDLAVHTMEHMSARVSAAESAAAQAAETTRSALAAEAARSARCRSESPPHVASREQCALGGSPGDAPLGPQAIRVDGVHKIQAWEGAMSTRPSDLVLEIRLHYEAGVPYNAPGRAVLSRAVKMLTLWVHASCGFQWRMTPQEELGQALLDEVRAAFLYSTQEVRRADLDSALAQDSEDPMAAAAAKLIAAKKKKQPQQQQQNPQQYRPPQQQQHQGYRKQYQQYQPPSQYRQGGGYKGGKGSKQQ